MLEPTEPNRCARGHRCANRQTNNGPQGQEHIGATCDRPLCDPCLDHLSRILRDLPNLYAQLHAHLGTQQSGDGRGGTTGLKVPINLGVEALMARMIMIVTSWEEVVRDRAGHLPAYADRVRSGTQLLTACGYLAQRTTALVALDWCLVTRMTGIEWEWVEMNGPGAALELFALEYSVRRAIGTAKETELLAEPCWTCGVRALVRDTGSNHVQCAGCGVTISLDEHEAFKYRAAHMTGRLA
jgi:hypothetical protein